MEETRSAVVLNNYCMGRCFLHRQRLRIYKKKIESRDNMFKISVTSLNRLSRWSNGLQNRSCVWLLTASSVISQALLYEIWGSAHCWNKTQCSDVSLEYIASIFRVGKSPVLRLMAVDLFLKLWYLSVTLSDLYIKLFFTWKIKQAGYSQIWLACRRSSGPTFYSYFLSNFIRSIIRRFI